MSLLDSLTYFPFLILPNVFFYLVLLSPCDSDKYQGAHRSLTAGLDCWPQQGPRAGQLVSERFRRVHSSSVGPRLPPAFIHRWKTSAAWSWGISCLQQLLQDLTECWRIQVGMVIWGKTKPNQINKKPRGQKMGMWHLFFVLT